MEAEKIEDLVVSGKIKVNDCRVKKLSTYVGLNNRVNLNNKESKIISQKRYYILNKLVGYVSGVSDPRAKKVVMNLIREKGELYPIGRLDKNSRGLMIITNDRDFALKVTHLKYGCEREYIVIVKIPQTRRSEKIEQIIRYFKCGTILDGSKTFPAKIKIMGVEGDRVKFNIILKEGRKRQIRRIFKKVRVDVIDLLRIRIGSYKIGDLPSGKTRVSNLLTMKKLCL